jgi:hypothetical protein
MRARRPRPSEKTTARVIPGFSPLGHPCRAGPPRRGGLRTPAMTPLASPEHLPVRPPAVRLPPMIMLCLGPYGLAMRTHGVHPSEKTVFRVISGSSPEGHPSSAWPLRGGAGSARPQELHDANPYVASFWPPTFRAPVRNHDLPRFASGPYLRTRGVRPSEKTAFHVLSGTSPKGPLLERFRMA